jgi:hypothetical protein
MHGFNYYFILGNDTNIRIDRYTGFNNDFYIFDFNNNEWQITTADELANPSANISKLLFPSFPSSNAGISSSKAAIIGLSVGVVLVALAVVGILVFIYYRRNKHQSKEEYGHPTSDGLDPSSQRSTLYTNQQYAPSTQYQFRDDYSTLLISSDDGRFSNISSNYYPGGNGTEPHNQGHNQGSESHNKGSETPPPPPPKDP